MDMESFDKVSLDDTWKNFNGAKRIAIKNPG